MIKEDIKNDLENFNKEPNILGIFGIENSENRHSNLLAYFLGTTNGHKLKNSFSKELIRVLKEKYKSDKDIDNINEDLSFDTYREVVINKREKEKKKKRIDILMISKKKEKQKIVIVIENKIEAGESGNQLAEYYAYINENYKGIDKVFLKLSPTGKLPEQVKDRDIWKVISYFDILTALKKIHERTMPLATKNIISDYINTLKFYLKVDKDIMNFCMQPEEKVKIDCFIKAQKTLKEYIERNIKNNKDITFCKHEKRNDKFIKFGTKAMSNYLKQTYPTANEKFEVDGKFWEHSNYAYEFKLDNEKLVFQLVVIENKEIDNTKEQELQKLKEFLYNPEEQKIPIGDKKNWFIVQKEEFVFADQDIKKLDNFIKECFKSLENWEQEILGKNKDNTKIQFMENIKENNSSLYALFDSVLALQKGYLDRSQEYFTDQKELNF